MEQWLVTGGAGFIGANFVRYALEKHDKVRIVNLDALTYAGSRANLDGLPDADRHELVHGDIGDTDLVERLFARHDFQRVVHFAAESHVDRSIHGPAAFIQTNIVGTFNLIEVARRQWENQPGDLRFLHISTDEVYGTLGPDDDAFSESTPYAPNSPYAASKASADLLVRAYHKTYGFPVVTTNCSNNYGPYQYPEKLIPLMIINALTGKPLPVYGDGRQVRDWLYIDDHCAALNAVLEQGRNGETYNIGGRCEMKNIEIVELLCRLLDEMSPRGDGASYNTQIQHVQDRPGHDRRYAVDASKITEQLDWCPQTDFPHGIRDTIRWYLANERWVNAVMNENYDDWIAVNYSDRG